MVRFQDPRLYVKGTCNFILCNTQTGGVMYQDNKFQTNNITTSATVDPIRGGLGNPPATIIASDSNVQVQASSAAFSLFAKAAQVGAPLSYNAVAPQCQVVEAESTTLSVDVTNGTPVAQYGYATPFCYVLEVGVANLIAQAGAAYPIDPSTGEISGFTAQAGTSYKVWYFVNKASAQMAQLRSQFDPGVYHATAQMAVYANQTNTTVGENGTRVGWLYYVIPFLKMGAAANLVGDQTTPDTTDLSGTALYADDVVESGTCQDCGMGTLAYYIYVPDDSTTAVTGLAIVGGEVTVPQSNSVQVPVKLVMPGGQLVQPNYSELSYALSGEPSGTSVSETGVITAGATTGDCEITASYPKTDPKFTVVANVSVT